MTTEVVILAQGTQRRLGMQAGYKQLLPLPECDGVSILWRTLCQLEMIHDRHGVDTNVRIVCWPQMHPMLPIWSRSRFGGDCLKIEFVTLSDPGNSSLKGIARYLEARREERRSVSRTVVLLGDVIYSWACLDAIWRPLQDQSYGFVGSSDLSSSGGELWGISWSVAHEDTMAAELRDALLRHPPFEDEYQPGQLRRWLQGWRNGDLAERVQKLRHAGVFWGIDDYTTDIDLPAHLERLLPVSVCARADDLAHGLVWDRLVQGGPTP